MNCIVHGVAKSRTQLSDFHFSFFFSFILLVGGYFTKLQCFLPYIDMNQPWIHMCSPSQSPLPPPSPSHPSGSSQCTSPEHLSHASNLGWQSVSHLITYLFQCYSLRSSHPRFLPQSPKVCSIHLCLFFLSCIQGYRYHLSKFDIYALIYCIGLYLSGLLHSV